MLLLLPLCAQPPQEGGKRERPAPKNLKVLTPEQLHSGIMQKYAAALGQRCGFCHVQGDFASDEKQTKLTARHMIEMTQHINSQFPDGKEHVTCYTCHRGATAPLTGPPDAAGGN